MSKLHIVELKGRSRQRGWQHGKQLKGAIQQAIDFYRSFFRTQLGMDHQVMRARAAQFIEPTFRISPLLMQEYEGIADGSGQSLEDIFCLSARYEITYESVTLGECSNLFVGPGRTQAGHTLLGQNWDWRPEVMDFRAVLIAHCDDVPDHMMITECGQPGKYGLNAHGWGLAAAGLNCRENIGSGDQLFVVLGREMLAQDQWADASSLIEEFPPRATVNLLLAHADGRAVDLEATAGGVSRCDIEPDQVYWHTNHCLHADEPCTFHNSLRRGQRWEELTRTSAAITTEVAKGWLADRKTAEDTICQIPQPSRSEATTTLLTIASIVMDLNERTMWVSDGPSCQQPYLTVTLPAGSGNT